MSHGAKESKSSATIRRRQNRFVRSAISAVGTSIKHQSINQLEESDTDLWDMKKMTGPHLLKRLLSRPETLFCSLLAFRCVNAMIIQTSYVPDEYWQCLEPAHRIAFGYGYETWEWKKGIRGYLHPAIFGTFFVFLKTIGLDNRVLLIKAPRLLQAVFSAYGDFRLYKLAYQLGSPSIARWTLFCQLASWFTFYCGVRTLSNSMEASLTSMALSYFPWPNLSRNQTNHWKYLVCVCIAVLMRPTAAILWLPMCLWHLTKSKRCLKEVLKYFVIVGCSCLFVSLAIDRVFYNRWIFVQYNFLRFNFLSGGSSFYGTHPWHWYISQGLPALLGPHLPVFLLAMLHCQQLAHILWQMIWVILVYSYLPHKEFRFIFPVLPHAMLLCGAYLDQVTSRPKPKPDQTPQPSQPKAPTRSRPWSHVSLGHAVVAVLLVTNVPLMLYTSLLHQRGTVDVMKYLYDDTQYQSKTTSMKVVFLMPCHSTPYYSYIHKNISLSFLTCEPNFKNKRNYTDEADVFYSNPTKWLAKEYKATTPPSHIVSFHLLQPVIRNFTATHQYKVCDTFFHTHFPEGRVGSHVTVLCAKNWLENKAVVKRKQELKHMLETS